MKKDNKFVCIRDIISNEVIDNKLDNDINIEMTSYQYKKKTIENKKKVRELEKLISKNKQNVVIFKSGKTYEVSSIFADIITIKSDINTYVTFSSNENCYYTDYILSEYFITNIQYRRNKLQVLSDQNFNNFLKNLKNQKL